MSGRVEEHHVLVPMRGNLLVKYLHVAYGRLSYPDFLLLPEIVNLALATRSNSLILDVKVFLERRELRGRPVLVAQGAAEVAHAVTTSAASSTVAAASAAAIAASAAAITAARAAAITSTTAVRAAVRLSDIVSFRVYPPTERILTMMILRVGLREKEAGGERKMHAYLTRGALMRVPSFSHANQHGPASGVCA